MAERMRSAKFVLNIQLPIFEGFYFTLPCWSIGKHAEVLSAALANSGPLDFPSEKSFILFFAHEKGLGHMFQK